MKQNNKLVGALCFTLLILVSYLIAGRLFPGWQKRFSIEFNQLKAAPQREPSTESSEDPLNSRASRESADASLHEDVNSKDIADKLQSEAKNSGTSQKNLAPIQRWVKKQSSALNSTNSFTDSQLVSMQRLALQLKETDRDALLQTSLDSQNAVNERILSIYLLSLGPTGMMSEAIVKFAESAPPDFGPTSPHSENELRHTQEAALRVMAVDELALKATKDIAARKNLARLAETASTETIRNYARRKLNELQ